MTLRQRVIAACFALVMVGTPVVARASAYTVTQGIAPSQMGYVSATGSNWSDVLSLTSGTPVQSYTCYTRVITPATLYRGLVRFGVSIPSSATVTSVRLSLYKSGTGTNQIAICSSTRSGNSQVVGADYSSSSSLLATAAVVEGGQLIDLPKSTIVESGELWIVLRDYPSDYMSSSSPVTVTSLLARPILEVDYTLPVQDVTNLSIEPTVTLSGPISIDGTVPVSFDTTALAAAIAAALPTASVTATETTGTVAVTIAGIGTWTTGALNAILVLATLGVGVSFGGRFGRGQLWKH